MSAEQFNTFVIAAPAATTPLAGTELVPIIQGGVTKNVTASNLTSGGAFLPLTGADPMTGSIIFNDAGTPTTFAISLQDATATNVQGSSFNIVAANGNGSGPGGNVQILSGNAPGSGVGGNLTLAAGNSSGATGGNVLMEAGHSALSGGSGGTFTINGGDATGGGANTGGPISLVGGAGDLATGTGGNIEISGGAGATPGLINLNTAVGTATLDVHLVIGAKAFSFENNAGSILAGTIQAPPSVTPTPVATGYYGTGANNLTDPIEWVQVMVNGNLRLIPLY